MSGCKRLAFAASLATLFHIVGPTVVRAGIVLTITDYAGHTFTTTGGNNSASTYSIAAPDGIVTVGDFQITATVTSNFPSGPTPNPNSGRFLSVIDSTIKNEGTASGSLYIFVSEAGFSLPTPPASMTEYLNSSISVNPSALSDGPGVASLFTSYLHQANGLPYDITTGTQVTTTVDSTSIAFKRTAPTFDLRSATVITLAGGEFRSLTGNTSVTQTASFSVQAVPEPASVVALLTSIPLLAGGNYLRRRRKAG